MKTIIKEYKVDDFGNNIELTNEYIIEDDLTLFVYDNCHKIYLIEDKEDIESVKKTWGKDTIFYNIDELPKIWKETCPLRFISNWKLDKQIIRQCYNATIKFED